MEMSKDILQSNLMNKVETKLCDKIFGKKQMYVNYTFL